MSAQMALMGLSAAGSALSAVSSIEGGYAKASAYRLQKQQLENQQEEVALQTALEEKKRRRDMAELLAMNEFDGAARGVAGGPGSSTEALQAGNLVIGNEDIRNIRLMGEAKGRRLSFAAKQQETMASSAITSGWMQGVSTMLGAASKAGVAFSGGVGGSTSSNYSDGNAASGMSSHNAQGWS